MLREQRNDTMKKLWLAFAFLLALLPLHAGAQGKTHRIVFAVTSGNQADWSRTLAHVRNLKKALAPEPVEVEVVAYSAGILMVKADSPVAADIDTELKDGVIFVACENAMRGHNLTKADLIPGTGTVPAGIAEVVKKQEAGWSYINGS
jgi:intracellular sulfur oxidation DsrE/DsrF family protein